MYCSFEHSVSWACVYHFKFTSQKLFECNRAHVNSSFVNLRKFYDMKLVPFSFAFIFTCSLAYSFGCLPGHVLAHPHLVSHSKLGKNFRFSLYSWWCGHQIKRCSKCNTILTSKLSCYVPAMLFFSSFIFLAFEWHIQVVRVANSILSAKKTWIASLNANHRSKNCSILYTYQTLNSIDWEQWRCPYRLAAHT